MCIAEPMRVLSVHEGRAWCQGTSGRQEVRTALVGALVPGDWVLVFLGDARERLDEMRAREVQATLALVREAMQADGGAPAGDPPAAIFELPSRMGRRELDGLVGADRAPMNEGEGR